MSGRFLRATMVVAACAVVAAQAASAAGPQPVEQRFVPNVGDAYNAISQSPDAVVVARNGVPEPTDCKHIEGLARKDAADGTPYMIMTKSGLIPPDLFCSNFGGSAEPGYLIVARMGSRPKFGERLGTNFLPYDTPLASLPILASDKGVTSVPLDGSTPPWGGKPVPAYRHPGGVQVLGDVLAVGVENPLAGGDRATVLFFDVSNPEQPKFYSQLHLPDLDGDANKEFGADPVGLTSIKTETGECCRYLLVVAGGPANKDVRFYRSRPTDDPSTPAVETTTDLKSETLAWDLAGRYTESELEDCLGVNWPEGSGPNLTGQHQMLNFVRQGNLDGPLYLIGGRRTGAIVNPFSEEKLDLYDVHLFPSGIPKTCPLSHRRSREMGRTSWGGFTAMGSLSAGSSVYVSPTGELMVYVSSHALAPGDTFIFGEFRIGSLVRPDSPTLRPTVKADGPFVVDEGSSVGLTGRGEPAVTKAFIELFSNTGIGDDFTSGAWMAIEYDTRDADAFDQLDFLHQPANQINEAASSWRWFAPPGCTISANDYPQRSDEFPGPDTVQLRGTGQFEEVSDLSHLPVYRPPGAPYPVSPVPFGQAPTMKDYDNDVGGVTFYSAYRDANGSLIRDHDCERYYNAPIGLSWDLDGNGVYETAGTSATFSAASLDGPSTATVYARGQHPTDTSPLGTGAPVPVPVAVRNVAPTVGAIGGPAGAVAMGVSTPMSASFTDPGKADTHTAVWDWGDGTTSTGVVTESNGSGTVTGSHTYTSSNFYTVTLTVTDDDGGSGQSAAKSVIVFDPTRSLSVSGKIVSPPGAYLANPAKTGDALVTSGARYKNGVWSGATSFQFNAASFSFTSTSYDWLVVTANRGYLSGAGKVNGVSGYSFLVSVVDQPDRFRLKVWKTSSNTVVYDSQPGAATTAPATAAVTAGSVVLG